MKYYRAYCATCDRAFAWRGSPIPRAALCPGCGAALEGYALRRTPALEPVAPPRAARATCRVHRDVVTERRRRVVAALRALAGD